eukprot:TRINITY_DN5243_c0_g1_i2.p1 TRINITY_DN5243_c0_g1~~TRINITY_DN5243_c0_g1_i2.p1  ORF type:complete len:294 (-),score=98.62 TRINITY_DN5243_c0_g1_i2:465-1346(-)
MDKPEAGQTRSTQPEDFEPATLSFDKEGTEYQGDNSSEEEVDYLMRSFDSTAVHSTVLKNYGNSMEESTDPLTPLPDSKDDPTLLEEPKDLSKQFTHDDDSNTVDFVSADTLEGTTQDLRADEDLREESLVESVDEEGSIIDHGSDEYDPLLVPTQSLSSQPTITISTDANDPGEFTIPPLLYPDDHEFEDDLHGDNLLDSNKESFSSDSTEATSDNRTSISNLIYGINSKNNEENIPVARGDIDLIDPDFPSIEEYTLAESDPRMSFPDLEIEDIENISLAENSMADLTGNG